MTERTCEWCGDAFYPAKLNQRFCQLSCGTAWNNEAARRGRELLRQEATTYAALAASALSDECGGRYAIERPRPLLSVNDLPPEAVPGWSHDPVGPEPPLGVDVNEVPDLGFPEGRHE
ncbi:MAG: hypothetical protein WCB09_00710 [Methylocella sp.]